MKNVLTKRRLKEFQNEYPEAKKSIEAWTAEVQKADWNSHNELKEQFGSASIINNLRVVFNIKGNKYRLVVDILYKNKFVYVVWFGTHKQYDKIDVNALTYP